MQLHFTTPDRPGYELFVAVNHLVIAGWAGRDQEAVMHHIRELEALGVSPPGAVPLFYRVTAGLLTQETHLEVVGMTTSGEAEPFVFFHDGEYWVSIVSDHTDRHLETFSVALSKQVCVKPVASVAWQLSKVAEQWDAIELRSWIKENNRWVLYQEGRLVSLLTPQDLLSRCLEDKAASEGFAISCGTLPALGGIRPANEFRMSLHNPVTGQSIEHHYVTGSLPVVA
ncbi:DUF2848 domain-containing protein [uncultured Pantoea sp.]|uniref:DUF2848 domain-containing protein n=1 Tax=uncultured Pantoea sp. TaxID=218084 RepID=UPI00258DB55B|nr:DUF2848 domain-containing protein [uncultured Pantoea sp.]